MAQSRNEPWLVEVRRTNPLNRETDDWVRVAECEDSLTAIAVADAFHNLMQTGLVKSHLLQVRTRASSEEQPGKRGGA